MATFFIAGIHGVGKTTACGEVARSLGIDHYTASNIIREAKASAVSERTKVVADLEANQQLLIDGVHRLLDKGHRLLLDGHFTLMTSNGIEPIPVRVFAHLKIRGIVLYSDAPESIAARTAKRDGGAQPLELLRLHQDSEMRHAKAVANTLTVPLVNLSAFDVDGLRATICNWL